MSASILVASPTKPAEEWPWVPCPMCWGQKVIWHRTGVITDTETGMKQGTYRGDPCPHCFGIGEQPETFSV